MAKALEEEVPDADLTHSPTRTGTAVGVIMGTAGYMSPEQARGQAVDKRTDIWAFGCVLYEMLTGRQVFGGETVTDILAAIVGKEPNWEALPEGTPRAIRRLLRRCLEKDPHDRLHHIADARIEIQEVLVHPGLGSQPARAVARSSVRRRILPWAVAAIMTIVALGLAVIDSGQAPKEMGTVRFQIPPPETQVGVAGPSVSPDGKQIAFVGSDGTGRTSLWVHKMDSGVAQRLDGTSQVAPLFFPFWSPDSRFLGFFLDGKLKKMDLSGGPAVSLVDAPIFYQRGTWNRQGTMLFGSVRGPIYRVSAAGGEATAVTQLDPSRQEVTHRYPYFLPDGRHYLYLA